MRLKNKKTGEIVIANVTRVVSGVDFDCGQTLAELNAEWEDVPEEPKEYWFIDTSTTGLVRKIVDTPLSEIDKEIGNYFETKEEAELAVRKLKAWKRLRDNGFRFTHYNTLGLATIQREEVIEYKIRASMHDYDDEEAEEIEADLDLLFGGEE